MYYLKNKSLIGTVMVLALLISSLAVSSAYADDTDPWTDIPMDEVKDLGEMWGNLIQFEYYYNPDVGNQAESITWDFGDGSERSNEWNPQHFFEEPGIYYIVQHVTNSYDGGSEDWGYYKISIMGKPYVKIIVPEGAQEVDNVYTTINTAPDKPDDPEWEGYTFTGYYADAEYTVPYNWSLKINKPVTVYAAFTDGDGALVPVEPTDPVEPDESDEDAVLVVNSTILALCLVGGIFGVVALYYRHPVAALIALIFLLGAMLGLIGIIDVPDVIGDIDELPVLRRIL